VPGDCSASGASLWEGGIYKVAVPWVGVGVSAEYGDTGDPGDSNEGYYVDDPVDAVHAGINPWAAFRMFTADGPVTAAPSLSMDEMGNLWVYFGTGRYLTDDDKTNTDPQFLYGIKDRFFNPEDLMYYHQYIPSSVGNLFDADTYAVLLDEKIVLKYDSFSATWEYFKTFKDFLDYVRYGADESDPFDDFGGWKRSLVDGGERCVTKASIIGGIVLTTTFVPNDDICGYGGNSYLYGLYYETGTPFYKAVFAGSTSSMTYTDEEGDSQTGDGVAPRTSLGQGMSSSVGIHMGKEEGARGLIQQSTGVVLDLDIDPALRLKSRMTSWREN
jgi:type IV pilus assembly protein PilY1